MNYSGLSSGIIAATAVPFHDDRSINWKELQAYIAQVAEGNPKAIALNMAVGEVSSLSIDEQLQVIRRCREVVGDRSVLLSGISATSTETAVDLAKKLAHVGAGGLVVFPPAPAFLGQPTLEMIADYHGAIADAVALPFFAFQTQHSTYPYGSIKTLSEIPNVVAVKDASFDVEQTLQNVEERNSIGSKIGILTGSDTFILEAILMGCDGALIGFAATATAALVEMHNMVIAGKITEAYQIWCGLAPLARICWRQPIRDYRVRMKYVLFKQGILSNYLVRSPMPALSEKDKADIDALFESSDLKNYTFHPSGHKRGSREQRVAGT